MYLFVVFTVLLFRGLECGLLLFTGAEGCPFVIVSSIAPNHVRSNPKIGHLRTRLLVYSSARLVSRPGLPLFISPAAQGWDGWDASGVTSPQSTVNSQGLPFGPKPGPVRFWAGRAAASPCQRRRRDIVVEPNPKPQSSPVGAAYSARGDARPTR